VDGKVVQCKSIAPYARSGKPFSYSYDYDDNNRPDFYAAPSGAYPTTVRNTYGYVSGLVDGLGGKTVWAPTTEDAENHVTYASFPNGINTAWAFSATTGRETGSSTSAAQMIQWESLTWDQLGNLTERNDHINALDEKYGYDELNRLLSITLNGAAENSFTYDVLGDMLTKGDVGTYTYPPNGSAQPHGVSKITKGSNVTNVVYDADGNILTESGATSRTMSWTPYNMPLTVQYSGGNTLTFQYDADHNRVMQTEAGNTTYYLPDGEQTPGAV